MGSAKDSDSSEKERGWIMDGNYMSQPIRKIIYKRAQIVIWLDYDFWIVFYQCVVRTFLRVLFRKKVCNGNVETWSTAFCSKDSMIYWVWNRHYQYTGECNRVSQLLLDYPQIKLIRLRSPFHCNFWLKSVIARSLQSQ